MHDGWRVIISLEGRLLQQSCSITVAKSQKNVVDVLRTEVQISLTHSSRQPHDRRSTGSRGQFQSYLSHSFHRKRRGRSHSGSERGDFGITTAGYVLLCLGQLRDPQYWLQVPRALQREEEVEDIAAHKSEAGSAEQVVMPEQVGRT